MGTNGWDFDAMKDHLPYNIVDYVKQYMGQFRKSNQGDKPWWTKTSSGLFTVKVFGRY